MAKKPENRGGGKLNRTQTVTIRLDPRVRYLTDLAARTQRRTTSGFIEWAIERAFSEIVMYEGEGPEHPAITLMDQEVELWDVDEADRFAKLALYFPNLLTYDEQVLWKLITENYAFWTEVWGPWELPRIEPQSMNFKVLRQYWDTLNAVANGTADISELPPYTSKHKLDEYRKKRMDKQIKKQMEKQKEKQKEKNKMEKDKKSK